MKLRNANGAVVSIGDERAERLLKSGGWSRVEGSQKAADASDKASEGDDTGDASKAPGEDAGGQESGSERPDSAEVRAWAAENNVAVSDKGRIAQSVYDQYAAAHQS